MTAASLLRPAAARFSIRLVCATYPPVLGGTEIEVQRVSTALRARGHEVKVLCCGGAPLPNAPDWVDPFGVPVRAYARWCPAALRGYAYAVGVAWTLWRERREYEVVYLAMGGLQLATALPVARLLSKHIVMKFSGSNTIAPLSASRLGRFELRLLDKWANRILLLNPAMMDEAERAGLSRSRLMWMPNPVDCAQFRPVSEEERCTLRRARSIPGDAPVILFVGRLAPEKELASLLESFASVARARADAILAIVGAGPLDHDLKRLAASLDITDKVMFPGAVSQDAVRGWMQAADVFALVSSVEGFPCALSEAMATGLASVVSDIPANTQLIEDGVHGLTAPCGDTEAIEAAILRLIHDVALRQHCGCASRNLVSSRYSTDQIADRYESLFAEVSAASAQRQDGRV